MSAETQLEPDDDLPDDRVDTGKPTGAHRPRPRARMRVSWLDRLVSSDPGQGRLRFALQNTITIVAIMAAEWVFVYLTHALQIPTGDPSLSAAKAAEIAGFNRYVLIIAMVIGGLVGLFSSLGVLDPTAKGQLVSILLLPVPAVAAFSIGLVLGGNRIIDLILLPVVLALANYGRRFGARGFAIGLSVSVYVVIGVVSSATIKVDQLGWTAAEIVLGVVVAIAVRFALFYPRPARTLRRLRHSYRARATKVARSALALFDDDDHTEGDSRRLDRQLVELNEVALMIDGLLSNPAASAHGPSGQQLHQRLLEVELSLTNIAQLARIIGQLDVSPEQHRAVRQALISVFHGDKNAILHASKLIELLGPANDQLVDEDSRRVILHRFATSVVSFAEATSDNWTPDAAHAGDGAFQSQVALAGGWLPAAGQVSAMASLESGRRLADRTRMAPYTRTAVQMAVAVAAAVVLGNLLSGPRFFWAVITVFVIFTGPSNSGEQSIKAIFRAVGTALGFVIGSVLVLVAGHDHPVIALSVIFVTLFLSFYLFRINYGISAIGITVTLALAFGQQGVFSTSLLLLRVEETALGAAIGIIVATVIFPLRTRRILRVALRRHIQALGRLVDHAGSVLVSGDRDSSTLRADVRAVDAAYQAVLATARPNGRNLFGSVDEQTSRALRIATAARDYSRNLVNDVEAAGALSREARSSTGRASSTLRESVNVVAGAISGPRDTTYTRSSALFDRAQREVEKSETPQLAQLPISDLKLIDDAMAEMAEMLGLAVTG